MAFNENFTSGLGSYALVTPTDGFPNGGWDSGVGNTSGGSVKLYFTATPGGGGADSYLANGAAVGNPTGNTLTINSGFSLYFNYKVVGADGTATRGYYGELRTNLGALVVFATPAPTDAAWHQFSQSLAAYAGHQVTSLYIQLYTQSQTTNSLGWVDSISIAATPPAFGAGVAPTTLGAKLYYGLNGLQANKALQI